ncbi:MAG: hypothetical protein RSG77_05410 [Hafnia sp.]|uniref:fimbrial protein n=1 Tax=Hafnia sp. TaxID=1873498 RepID=UPI002FCB0DA7
MALLIFPYSAIVNAAESVEMKIHVTGHIRATGSCTFSKKGPLNIGFGTVLYSTLGGNTLKDTSPQSLTSSMSCTGDYAGQTTMQLIPTITGETDYQGVRLMQVMDDSKGVPSKDLGIRLLVNGAPQNVNEAFNVDMTAQPTLKVELVQIGNGDGFVNGAAFSAAATLTMAFL